MVRDSVHKNWDVIKARRFGHFWPFLWVIAHNFFDPETISTAHDTGYTKIGTSSKLTDLVISGRFHGQMHTVFLAPGRFQRLVTPGTF